ncbi:uncharacterized protein LOC143253904 isoform X2 [Tachypleus tridentatus]
MAEISCYDRQGVVIQHGNRYFPMESDPCTQCTCIKGMPEMCISVFCYPPENCQKYHAEDDKCCQFVCDDESLAHFPGYGKNNSYPADNGSTTLNATNLGLRLVAGAVTSLLILALLLFMINRLRRRRLLLMIRRFHSRGGNMSESQLSQRFSLDGDDAGMGYFMGRDHAELGPFDDPSPPYAFWKPPETYIPPGEAPPPHEASVDNVQAPYSVTSLSPYRRTSQVNVPLPPHHSSPPVQEATETAVSEDSSQSDKRTSDETSSPSQPVVSTVNITCENEGKETSSVSLGNTAIRSDVRYEDIPIYMPDNVTVLHIRDRQTSSDAALRDEDITNGNIPMNPEAVEKEEFPNEKSVPASAVHNHQLPEERESVPHGSRHSYNDIIEYWQHRLLRMQGNENKRLSLQPAGDNNNIYPDPTTWNGEVSETSSSSSPTYEQQTFSPSSSDSSSMDVDFDPNGGLKQNVSNPHKISNQEPSQVSSSSAGKFSSVDRTLQHLRRFSLNRKNQKKNRKRGKGRGSEQASYLKRASMEARALSPDANFSSFDVGSPVKINPIFQDSECTCINTSLEAVNPHITDSRSLISRSTDGQEVAASIAQSPRKNSSVQPNDLCSVSKTKYSLYNIGSVSPEFNDTTSPEKFEPVSPTVIAVRCRTNAVVNQLLLEFRLPSSNNLQSSSDAACTSHQNCLLPAQGMFQASKLSRSGSVCSETGERKFVLHKDTCCASKETAENGLVSSGDISSEKVDKVETSTRHHLPVQQLDVPLHSRLRCSLTSRSQEPSTSCHTTANTSCELEISKTREDVTSNYSRRQHREALNVPDEREKIDVATHVENNCASVATPHVGYFTQNLNHFNTEDATSFQRKNVGSNSSQSITNESSENSMAGGARPRHWHQLRRGQRETNDVKDSVGLSNL